MPKKRNTGYGSSKGSYGGSDASVTRNWGKVKSGGPAFKEVTVPVNTKSRKVPSGC